MGSSKTRVECASSILFLIHKCVSLPFVRKCVRACVCEKRTGTGLQSSHARTSGTQRTHGRGDVIINYCKIGLSGCHLVITIVAIIIFSDLTLSLSLCLCTHLCVLRRYHTHIIETHKCYRTRSRASEAHAPCARENERQHTHDGIDDCNL